MVIRNAGALGVCLTLLCSSVDAAEKKLDRSFPVSPGGQLTVDADASEISVTGSDASEVIVHIAVYGAESQLDRMDLSAEAAGNDVTVKVKSASESWRSWFWVGRDGGKINIEVPRQYRVGVQTSAGNIVISGVRGEALAKTSAGDIRVEEIRGPVSAQSSAGNVHAQRIEGATRLNTAGGNIEGEALTGDVEAEGSGGNIRLHNIGGKIRARTSSGDLIVAGVRGDIDLGTSGGNIQAQSVDGVIAAQATAGNVEAQLVGANRGIQVSTSGGNIVIRVPAKTAAQLDASAVGGSISSDLIVATREVARNKLRGLINLGGPLISAHTTGGNISLQAE